MLGAAGCVRGVGGRGKPHVQKLNYGKARQCNIGGGGSGQTSNATTQITLKKFQTKRLEN
jgi:hypothetical protein